MATAHKLRSRRAAFTLVEMLLVLGIIAILTGFVLAAVAGARASAQVTKTRSLITRLNSRLMAKWDSYRYRRLDYDPTWMAVAQKNPTSYDMAQANFESLRDFTSTNPATQVTLPIRFARMKMLWELQRWELPDKWSDIYGDVTQAVYESAVLKPYGNDYVPKRAAPAALLAYRAICQRTVAVYNATHPTNFDPETDSYSSAECLYLIMTAGLGEDGLSPEELAGDSIGDKDGDGFLEFHDAWGNPINFLRWAPGFISELQPLYQVEVSSSLTQARDPRRDPDPLDLTRLMQPPTDEVITPSYGFRLTPLIYSAGPDGQYGILGSDEYGNEDTIDSMDDPNGLTPDVRLNYKSTSLPIYIGRFTKASYPYDYVDKSSVFYALGGYNIDIVGGLPEALSATTDNIHNHQIGVK